MDACTMDRRTGRQNAHLRSFLPRTCRQNRMLEQVVEHGHQRPQKLEERRAALHGCAAERQQASIVFNVAAGMMRMCPALSKRVKILFMTVEVLFSSLHI